MLRFRRPSACAKENSPDRQALDMGKLQQFFNDVKDGLFFYCFFFI